MNKPIALAFISLILLAVTPLQGITDGELVPNATESVTVLGKNWYRVEACEAIVNISPEAAEKRAVDRARNLAIEYAAGVEVNQVTFNLEAETPDKSLRDYFSKIGLYLSNGFIVNQKKVSSDVRQIGPTLYCRVVLDLEVARQKGDKDPYFNLDVKPNKRIFSEGEKLELIISSSQDCHLNIINIYSNDTVSLLLPNPYQDNFAARMQPFTVPPPQGNYSIPLHLLPGKLEDSESLLVIATKQPLALLGFGEPSQYGTRENELISVLRQLARIPRNEMELRFLDYVIHSAEE